MTKPDVLQRECKMFQIILRLLTLQMVMKTEDILERVSEPTQIILDKLLEGSKDFAPLCKYNAQNICSEPISKQSVCIIVNV